MNHIACLVTILAMTTAGPVRQAQANNADKVLCRVKYPAWYDQYLLALRLLKHGGRLHDRLHAHGVLNDLLDHRNDMLVEMIGSLGGEVGSLIAWTLKNAIDVRCLKAGIDAAFEEAVPTEYTPDRGR